MQMQNKPRDVYRWLYRSGSISNYILISGDMQMARKDVLHNTIIHTYRKDVCVYIDIYIYIHLYDIQYIYISFILLVYTLYM